MTTSFKPTPPGANNGHEKAGDIIMRCPSCPDDFSVSTTCRIIKATGGKICITAADDNACGGQFFWSTTSSKIKLTNTNSATVTVEALGQVSSARDGEDITVTRSSEGCDAISKIVKVTVASVTFSASSKQIYGYDDFDTATGTSADTPDDHLSVGKSSYTWVKVNIAGGALSTDFDFIADDISICQTFPSTASASFDLRIKGGPRNKAQTNLHAKLKCPHATSFANIAVHVYKKKRVNIVVAKVKDSKSTATTLRFTTADYAAHTKAVNNKLKEAVVKFVITNYDAKSVVTDIRYDLDNNGVLTYDIANGGGRELNALKAAIKGTGSKTRIAIVRDMKSYYYLSTPAAIGDTTLTVTAKSVFDYSSNWQVALGTGSSQEMVKVSAVSGNTITLTKGVTKAHARAESIEFPAAGWSSDPIVIIEGQASLNTLQWTIPHEVGHRALKLQDVDDPTNIMHFSQSSIDYRLRYCPRNKKYEAGTENQWEKIKR